MITNPNTLGLFDDADRRHHRAGARHGAPGLSRRRQHERHPRHHPAGRLRRRHDALQRPQDVHRPARRRRPRRRAHRRPRAPRPVPAGAASSSRTATAYRLDYDRPKSIGRVRSFFGNVGILLRGYCYIRTLGPDGLREVSENAVLNANYLLSRREGRLRGAARRPLHARVRRQRPAAAPRAAHQRHGHRQAAARLRLPRADGLFPAGRARSDDDRADRDREQGDARRLRRRAATHPRRRPGVPAPGAAHARRQPARRGAGGRKEPVLRWKPE